MRQYRNPEIDDWRSDERYKTAYTALKNHSGQYTIEFAQSLLAGKYGFMCQYDRKQNADTVWSVIYDLTEGCIYRAEGNPSRKRFQLDTRFQFAEETRPLSNKDGTEWQPEEVEACMMDFAFRDEDHYQKCLPAYHGSMVLNRHPGSLTADLSFREHDKANGIEIFLKHTGIDRADTFAFGDGYNDVTMMQAVGCGIAMGNGVPAVKEAADYITDSIFDDGIYKALEHFSLI